LRNERKAGTKKEEDTSSLGREKKKGKGKDLFTPRGKRLLRKKRASPSEKETLFLDKRRKGYQKKEGFSLRKKERGASIYSPRKQGIGHGRRGGKLPLGDGSWVRMPTKFS